MSTEYIERGALMAEIGKHIETIGSNAERLVARFPAADVVSAEAYKQIMWERETAIAQLAEYGVGLGEKKKDVEPAAHARWEWFFEVDSTTNGYEEDYGWRCSGCRAKLTDYMTDGDVYDEYPIRMKYCPNCGRKLARLGTWNEHYRDLEIREDADNATATVRLSPDEWLGNILEQTPASAADGKDV